MDGERLRSGWAGLAAGVEEELAAWRAAHPRATLAEIEAAVLAALGRLQERYLSDLVHASTATDLRSPADRNLSASRKPISMELSELLY